MRFEQDIHWSEGLFLQPHHLQRLQRLISLKVRNERSFYLAYNYGLIDMDLDVDALENYRVVLRQFSAIMPGGEEISMPGNSTISPLDLTQQIEEHCSEIIVYLALPLWSDFEANLSEEGNSSKRQFSCQESELRDENSGSNEILITRHNFNVRLTTNFHDNADLDLLPIMRLVPVYRDAAVATLTLDKDYIPPYIILSGSCPLLAMAVELNIQLNKRKNKIIKDLTAQGYVAENLASGDLYSILQLRTLSSFERKLAALLHTGKMTPFDLYIELNTLLSELASLKPLRATDDISEYNHENYGKVFRDLFMQIRMLILAEGLSSYVKIDFEPLKGEHARYLKLKDEHLVVADEYYLAVSCGEDPRNIVESIENGDNFKLVNPAAGSARIRGVKLIEMRYPPRFLPALSNVMWFKLDRQESSRIWSEICTERGILLDWAEDMFPKLEATLYITILKQGEDK